MSDATTRTRLRLSVVRRHLLAVAAGSAIVFLLADNTTANHSCQVRVAKSEAADAPIARTLSARVGDTIYLRLHGLVAGEAALQWLVDGTWVKERLANVTVPADGVVTVRVELEPSDRGVVVVQPLQRSGLGSYCGDPRIDRSSQRATILVAAAETPATDVADAGRQRPRGDARPFLALICAAVLVALAWQRPRWRRRG